MDQCGHWTDGRIYSRFIFRLTYSHIGIYLRYGTGGDNFGCVQCGSRAAAARNSGASGGGRAAGGRSCDPYEARTAFGFEASEGATRRGAGASAAEWTSYVVSNKCGWDSS